MVEKLELAEDFINVFTDKVFDDLRQASHNLILVSCVNFARLE